MVPVVLMGWRLSQVGRHRQFVTPFSRSVGSIAALKGTTNIGNRYCKANYHFYDLLKYTMVGACRDPCFDIGSR